MRQFASLHQRVLDDVTTQYELDSRNRRKISAPIERATATYTADGGGGISDCALLRSGRYVHEAGVYFEYRVNTGSVANWRAYSSEVEREAAISRLPGRRS